MCCITLVYSKGKWVYMEIINNRYKINSKYKENNNQESYTVSDLWGNLDTVLKIIREDSIDNEKIDYLVDNFLFFASINHRNIVGCKKFDIIHTVDNKPVRKKKYLYTTEHRDSMTLSEYIKDVTDKEIPVIIFQLLNLVNYLRYRGIAYKYLNPNNIFITKDEDELSIKAQDLVTTNVFKDSIFYKEFDRHFIAPEVKFSKGEGNFSSDIYSLGMIIYYIFTNNAMGYIEGEDFSNQQKSCPTPILNIVNEMTKKEPSLRETNFHKISELLNSCFNTNISLNMVEDREKLNFNTRLIARGKELSRILNINEEFERGIYNSKLIGVNGESGIGKTRFLREAAFRLRIKGKDVYYTSIANKDKVDSQPIIKILKQMLKDCDSKLIDKYGSELVKVIPEIRFLGDIKPSLDLEQGKEKLRLYDRISNFIVDFVKNHPTYIMIDDFHNCDEETLTLLNYIVKNSKSCPLLIILSYSRELLEDMPVAKGLTDEWVSMDGGEAFQLLRFDLQETAEAIKNILGISYRPINFSARVMDETLGNPRHVEESIKNLYASKELFLSKEGFWESKDPGYTTLYIPSNIDDAMKSQVELLDKNLYEAARVISIFNTSVSKEILSKMLITKDVDLDDIVKNLVAMKILDERVEDWGYTYDFYNLQLKRYIYHTIDKDSRVDYHRNAADILERVYTKENRENPDELIHHFALSDQKDKAFKYTVDLAEKMKGFMGNSQCILLWEKAYNIIKEESSVDKIRVLINIGRLYTRQGDNEKALKMYREALDCSNRLNALEFTAKCKNHIAEIYFARNNIAKARSYTEEAKEISHKIGDIENLLDAVIVLNRIYISQGEFNKVLVNSRSYIKIARENKKHIHVGKLYNHIGLANMYMDKVELGGNCFEKSLIYLHEGEEYMESTRPINNIGVIYADYLEDKDKALEYFKKGLEICRKYGYVQNEAVFLNNIGELYLRYDDYQKSKRYATEAYNIINQIEDDTAMVQSNINLGYISLNTGEYDKAFKHFYFLKDYYGKDLIQKHDISKYYEFLSSFYHKFGQWDKAIKYEEMANEVAVDVDRKKYLNGLSRSLTSRFWRDRTFDKNQIEYIREEYKGSNFINDRRKNLVMFAYISLLSGEREYAEEILREDEKLSEVISTEYIDLMRRLVMTMMVNDSLDMLLEIEKDLQNKTFVKIELFANMEISNKYLIKGKYYDSANYCLNALDILYRLGKKIPDADIAMGYIKSHGIMTIKERINRIKLLISNSPSTKSMEDGEYTDFEQCFDFDELSQLFNNEGFISAAYKQFDNPLVKDLNSIEDLLTSFSSNYKHNLEMIIQYAAKETLAKRGYVLVYKEGTEELFPIVSTTDSLNIEELDAALAKVKENNSGIVVRNTFKHNNNIYMVLSEDIKGLICIPIYKTTPKLNSEVAVDRRRFRGAKDNIIGYIYLDSDKLINRFDYKRYRIIESLAYLSFINIDNYYLKITSSIDKMTSVYTRKYFDTIFEEFIALYSKDEAVFSVVMLDIDKFKGVNDTFGHQKGDEILSRVGRITKSSLRDSDVVGRYGGEEFIILLPNADQNAAKLVAEKIRINIEESNLISKDYPLTVSLGISTYPYHGYMKEELIEKADQALYQAKEDGRNRSCIWSNNIGASKKRLDRLAGIVSGNTVQDQRNILAMVELIELLKKDIAKEEKIYKLLGRIIEITESNQGILLLSSEEGKILETFGRQRFKEGWIKEPRYNEKIVDRVIASQNGEFLIDWDNIGDIDIITGIPNWQSLIATPLISKGQVKGLLQISVPIKEKEFDYNYYNFVSTISDVIAAMI